MNMLQMVELERQRKRQRSLLEKILQGTNVDVEKIASVTETPTTSEVAPEETSLLGKILGTVLPFGVGKELGERATGLFDINQPPAEMIPLEQTIAKMMIKHKLKPKKEEEAKRPITQKIDNVLYQYDYTTGQWIPVVKGEQGMKAFSDNELYTLYSRFAPGGIEPEPKENLVFDSVKEEMQLRKLYPIEQKFSPEQEETIKANMDYYRKDRDEIIDALRKRGLLK